jgi:hypothetical protein
MKKKSNPRTKQKSKRTSPAATKKIPALFSGSSNAEPKKQEEQLTREQAQDARNAAFLAPRARSTILRLEARDRNQQAIEEEYEHEPMTSAPVWHVHQK